MWRCYVIWNGSRRVIWAPCVLWLTEAGEHGRSTGWPTRVQSDFLMYSAGLAIADAIIDFHNMDDFGDYQVFITDTVSSAQFFTSAATSLVATYLIAHRIYAASRDSQFSQKMFQNVVNIVIESSAVYTVCVILLGINNVVPPSDTDTGALMHDAATDYGGAIIWVIIVSSLLFQYRTE